MALILSTAAQFNLDRVGTFNVGSRDENGVFYKMCKTKTFLFMVCGLEDATYLDANFKMSSLQLGEEREGIDLTVILVHHIMLL